MEQTYGIAPPNTSVRNPESDSNVLPNFATLDARKISKRPDMSFFIGHFREFASRT